MKFPRCVVERISMKYDRNLGAFGTKERNEIWAEVGRNSGLRQPVLYVSQQVAPGRGRGGAHLGTHRTMLSRGIQDQLPSHGDAGHD